MGLNPTPKFQTKPPRRDVKYWSLSTILGTHVTGWLVCQGKHWNQVVSYRPAHVLPSSTHPCLRTLSSSLPGMLYLICSSPNLPCPSWPPRVLQLQIFHHYKLQPIVFFFPVSSTLVAVISSNYKAASQLESYSTLYISLYPFPMALEGEATSPVCPTGAGHGSTHGSHFFSNESFWCIPACFYGFS